MSWGRVLIPRAGRPNWLPSIKKIAYDKRTGAGWEQIYTCNEDGTNETSLTAGYDFWTGTWGAPAGTIRHVGNPTWSPDGQWLLFMVEAYDTNFAASISNDPNNHVSAQAGRGFIDTVWIMKSDGTLKTRLWNYVGGATDTGAMHAYFSPDQTKIAWSRMIDTGTAEATSTGGNWSVNVAPITLTGTPTLGTITNFNPSGTTNTTYLVHMNEVNSWVDNSTLAISGNPKDASKSVSQDDVFTCRASDGGGVIRRTLTSGQSGEKSYYDEHLVASPNGNLFAWMSSKQRGGYGGTEIWVQNNDLVDSNQVQVTFFNTPDHPMRVTPDVSNTAGTIVAARPCWNKDGTKLLCAALNRDGQDGLYGGEGPVYLVEGLTSPAKRMWPVTRKLVKRTLTPIPTRVKSTTVRIYDGAAPGVRQDYPHG